MMALMSLSRVLVLLLMAVSYLLITTFVPASYVTKSKNVDFILETRKLRQTSKTDDAMNINRQNNYIFNCTNINQIQLIRRDLGGGRSKVVDTGIFQGQTVVIKKISAMKEHSISFEYRQLLFLKEILLRDQLDHPGLIRMFGYCVRSLHHESYKDHPRYGGIVAVYENGYEFDVKSTSLATEDRLKYVLQFAELLVYLQHSPLGSLILGDFARHHVLIVDGNIRLIDLDYVHNIEPPCTNDTDCLHNVNCFKNPNESCDPYDGCQTGLCVGYNAQHNLHVIRRYFINELLNQTYFPKHICHMIESVIYKLDNHLIDAKQLVDEIKFIINGRFGLK